MIGARWTTQRERGSSALVKFMVWLTLSAGWHVGTALLYPITLYFFLCARGARRVSAAYLRRVFGRPARLRERLRHFFTFSCVILDRILLLAGRKDQFDIELVGHHLLEDRVAAGKGCVLLGAHLGSFEVLRAIAHRSPARVHALMFRGNAGTLTRLFERLDPSLRREVIEIGQVDSMLRVRETVARGEVVAILADRAPHSAKFVDAPFLGERAPFPTGPMILAALLDVPVLLCFAVRTGPRRYQVHVEPFAERIALRRASRLADLRQAIERYAERLEAWCRLHPYNWFNFYDFWESPSHAAAEPASPPAAPGADLIHIAADDRAAAGGGRRADR